MKTRGFILLIVFISFNLLLSRCSYAHIWSNNVAEVQKAIANGRNINQRNNLGRTPLISAIGNKSFEVAKLLVESGTDIDIRDIFGNPAILYAIEKKSIDIVKLLIENGADINIQTYGGNSTLLMAAVSTKSLDMVKLLIENGANINMGSKNAYTPLMYSASNNSLDIAKYLIEKGTDVNAETKKRELTALDIAKDKNDKEMVTLLINHGAQFKKPSLSTRIRRNYYITNKIRNIVFVTALFLSLLLFISSPKLKIKIITLIMLIWGCNFLIGEIVNFIQSNKTNLIGYLICLIYFLLAVALYKLKSWARVLSMYAGGIILILLSLFCILFMIIVFSSILSGSGMPPDWPWAFLIPGFLLNLFFPFCIGFFIFNRPKVKGLFIKKANSITTSSSRPSPPPNSVGSGG